jgi:hypothetical protein
LDRAYLYLFLFLEGRAPITVPGFWAPINDPGGQVLITVLFLESRVPFLLIEAGGLPLLFLEPGLPFLFLEAGLP